MYESLMFHTRFIKFHGQKTSIEVVCKDQKMTIGKFKELVDKIFLPLWYTLLVQM